MLGYCFAYICLFFVLHGFDISIHHNHSTHPLLSTVCYMLYVIYCLLSAVCGMWSGNCYLVLCRVDHIRVSRAHFHRSEGPTVARALAERLYANETYVLGIDSHCHFLRGWDNVVIDMFKRIGNDLAIITTYPDSYGEVRDGWLYIVRPGHHHHIL